MKESRSAVEERNIPLAAATLNNALFPDGTRMSVQLKGVDGISQLPGGLPGMPALPGLNAPLPAPGIPGLAPAIPGFPMH